MTIYVFLLVFSAVLALFIPIIKHSYLTAVIDNVAAAFLLMVLFIIYIVRGTNVGTDFPAYNMYLDLPPGALINVGIEKGYVFLNQSAQAMGSPLFLFAIIFLITAFGFIVYAKSESLSLSLFVVIYVLSYVYFMSFNMVRQLTAISIVFAGLSIFKFDKNTQDKKSAFLLKYLIFLVFVYIAMQFHTSAVIGAIIPLTTKIKVTKGSVLIAFVVMTVGFFTQIGNRIVPSIQNFFPYYQSKYSLSLDLFTNGTKGFVAYIPIALQFFFLFIIVSQDCEFVRNNKPVVALYLCYLFLFIGGGNQAITRIQYYWLPSSIIFTAVYIQKGKSLIYRVQPKLIKFAFVIFWLLYSLLRLFENNSGIVPYSLRF